MIIESVLGNVKTCETQKEIVPVSFEWFELEKKRMKKTACDGLEFGLAVSDPFTEGDILAETERSIYVVMVKPTELLKVNVSSMEEMGRACFELGNRHLSPKISEDSVKVVYDEPTYLYMEKLGFKVEKVTEKFTDYIVCKAHGQSHEHHHGSEHHGGHHEG